MQIQHRSELIKLLKYFQLPLKAAEIGVAEGLHSKELLDNGIEKLYCVDNWKQLNQTGDSGFDNEWHTKNYKEALKRFSDFGHKVIVLRGLSYEMASVVPDESLGLVYIDGDHSFEGVKKDIQAWKKKLVPNGIMAFHDYLSPDYGVKEAVKAHFYHINIIPENTIADAGAWVQI